MTNQNKVGEIRARITKQASDGKFYRFAADVEKYIEAFDNVEALELQLKDRVGQSTPAQSAQAVTGQAISTSTAAPPGYSFRSDVEAKQAIQALEKSGFDITKLSLVGKRYHSEEHPLGSSAYSYVLLVHGTLDDPVRVGALRAPPDRRRGHLRGHWLSKLPKDIPHVAQPKTSRTPRSVPPMA